MVMLPTKLASELMSMTPVNDEVQAANNLATAYANYCTDAMSNGIPITPAAVAVGKAAMIPALVGMSAPGVGATIMVNGFRTFWVTVAGMLAAAFPGATAITPPPFASLQAALTVEFASATALSDTLEVATQKVAAKIHADTIVGGTATFPPAIVGPIL